VLVAGLVGTCSQPPPLLQQIREAGELRVATRNSPTAYYEGRLGPEGPEYELAAGFARQLGVRLVIRVVPNQAAAVEEVRRNRAQLAAAGLAVTDQFRRKVDFGPVYQQVRLHVVRHRDGPAARDATGLRGRIVEVPAESAHAQALSRLAETTGGLEWRAVSGVSQLDIMARLSGQLIDFTVADSWEYSLGRHFHPELVVAFDAPQTEDLAWAVPRGAGDLLGEVRRYFDDLRATGRLEALLARYYNASESFDFVDSLSFVRHVEERLPALRPLFEQAALAEGIDWRLLAAIGYQESKWDPAAVSRTGVRGVMMLTEDTAERMGVDDRKDAAASIQGGARYYAEIESKIPPRIPEPDRTWLTLAAYNVGFGHLEDARILTQRAGRNADRWDDVRAHLPLLAQEQYFSTTRRGYARGWEPVHFVDNVRSYLRLLEWMGGGPGEVLRLRVTAEPAAPPAVALPRAREGDAPATPPGLIR